MNLKFVILWYFLQFAFVCSTTLQPNCKKFVCYFHVLHMRNEAIDRRSCVSVNYKINVSFLILFAVSESESDSCCRNFTACSVQISYPSARRDDTVVDNYHGFNVIFLFLFLSFFNEIHVT